MTLWNTEIKELEKLHESLKGKSPDLDRELEQLIKFEDPNVIMLYSRRCLEVIITDLCEYELKRPRKTEPLKGIIDKLHREEKVPSHIITSMDSLNSLSTYGTHPKEFDPEQVKPVLSNLAIIIKWYLKYKEAQFSSQLKTEKSKHESKELLDVEKKFHKPRKRLILLLSGILLVVAIIVVAFLVFNVIGGKKQTADIEKSIAVLPFVNLSNDPEQEYFSDGMVDEILDHLFKIGELKVISRTSSMRYKNTDLSLQEIANELGVSAILEGSVRKIGNNVRITAQLIDTKTDTHLWSETYERDLSDVFSIQSEVAQNVARELKATLTSRETELIQKAPLTRNQLAYDFYLKGNDYLSKRERSLAVDLYSRAILEDSLFTAAYARRAQAYISIYWYKYEGWEGHDIKGREDIKKGLQLNPKSPEIKFAEALAYYHLDRDYDKSLKIITELKAEAPNMAELYAWSSFILRRQGKLEESINELNKALKMDPFNADYIDNLIGTYVMLHEYDNQIKFSKQGLSRVPDYKDFKYRIFRAYMFKYGDLEVAQRESGLQDEDIQYDIYYYNRHYDKLIEFISNDISTQTDQFAYHANQTDQFTYHPKTFELALIYYLSGNRSLCKVYADSAITHLEEKIKENPNDERFYATLGKCYAFCGNTNEAIGCGKKAVELKPIKLDALQGPDKEKDLLEIYIFIGNHDMALDKIEFLLSIPSNFNIGDLLSDPIFDNMRSLPRFQKIINSTKS